MKTLLMAGAALSATLIATPALAQDHSHHNHEHHAGLSISGGDHSGHVHSQASSAPIGVMGDHTHGKGDWMVSYRYMRMEMDGNRDGTNELNPLEISGDFANVTGVGPATLRIVPTEMTMEMHMLGAMYGVTDWLTLGVMANYVTKDMDHVTFAGGNPDLQIGEFNTRSSGWGDTKLAGLFKVYEEGAHSIVAKAGLSLPTGSIDEEDDILNPMGARQVIRLPYAMQLGSGTYDLEPALTYSGHAGDFGWGAQYMGAIRLGENSKDYTLGDKHSLSGWGAYSWNENVRNSIRLTAETESQIDGRDALIAGPVQTANPEFYGGQRLELGLGLDLLGTQGALDGHRVAVEATVPLYQDLNGPQMQRDYGFTIGYSYAF